MIFGYARVSTDAQELTNQIAQLKAAGCERIFREKATGGRWNRPELQRLLDHLRKGDVLVVWILSCAGVSRSGSIRARQGTPSLARSSSTGRVTCVTAVSRTNATGRVVLTLLSLRSSFGTPSTSNAPLPRYVGMAPQ